MATPTRRLRLMSHEQAVALPGIPSREQIRRAARMIPPWCGRCIGPHWGPRVKERYLPDDEGFIDVDQPCPACNPYVVKRRA